MYQTARDMIISDVVTRMSNMTNEEISDYLNKCKGIFIEPEFVGMYRPLE